MINLDKYGFNYGRHQIEYFIKRKSVKNINLSIKPNLLIKVSASEMVPLEVIHSFVRKKASWIIKNKEGFMKLVSEIRPIKEYVSGETFKYLGNQYRLKVNQSIEESVNCIGKFINLQISNNKDNLNKAKLMNEWYSERSIKIFKESLDRMYKIIKKYKIKKPKILRRSMKLRWGSCIKSKNTIILNTSLIYAPLFCIDYVILHELIHLKNTKHNKDFYNLLATFMPDWEKRKEILDKEIVKVI